MAIDTAGKRRSAIKMSLPAPTGAFSQASRQHVTWNYSGILAIELILYIVVHGSVSLGPWIRMAALPSLAAWIAMSAVPTTEAWVHVETADIEDLTP